LGPSVDVAQSNQLGAAALTILHGSAALGHEKKINAADYGALLVAYIILNEETVGLFIYDEDDGAYVHHQFMSSRVERCLLAHAAEISSPFLPKPVLEDSATSKNPTRNQANEAPSANVLKNLLKPTHASPETLLSSALTHLTASQRLHRKLRAIRKSGTPVYAIRSNLSKSITITRLAADQCTDMNKEHVERSPNFVAWLSDKSDDEIARILEGCRLSDRPKHFKVLFETPERLTLKALRVLDTFDAISVELVSEYSDQFEVTKAQAKAQVTKASVRHKIDRGLIHQLSVSDIAHDIHSSVQPS